MLKSIFLRFVRGFVAGGIASTITLLQSGVVVSSLSDAKNVATSLVVAFLVGGLLAIDKAIRVTPEEPAVR